jgi:hypothetical protein
VEDTRFRVAQPDRDRLQRDQPARHAARTFLGLLTRTAATIAARTLRLVYLTGA